MCKKKLTAEETYEKMLSMIRELREEYRNTDPIDEIEDAENHGAFSALDILEYNIKQEFLKVRL